MSKPALSNSIRKATGCTVAQANAAVEAVLSSIISGVQTNGRFRIANFGIFLKSEHKARQGRNPKTGEPVKIQASASIKFKTAASLKKAL